MDWFPEDQLPSLIEGFLDSFEMKPFFDDQAEGAFLQRYEDQYQENDELCAKQADCELYGIEHSLKPRYIDILDDGYWGAGVSVTKDDHRTAQAQTPPSNVGRAQCSAASTGQQRFKREVIHHDSKPQIKKNSPPKGVGVSQERERISGLADMLQQPARHGPEVPARHQVQDHFKISCLSWLHTKRFSKRYQQPHLLESHPRSSIQAPS